MKKIWKHRDHKDTQFTGRYLTFDNKRYFYLGIQDEEMFTGKVRFDSWQSAKLNGWYIEDI